MKFSTMFYTVFDLNGMLEKTMKGADKAIVAKSFGKWKSSSLRSRTMEKPDEPSEESMEASLSKCTCEDPQLAKKPVGKEYLISYFEFSPTTESPGFFSCGNFNYYCGDLFFFFLFFLL
ncbi:hypothetical protein ILYODFUR_003844 [Ilyodon furcidens]|uniref:Uncharacterized protein n=1 Tax=Ilyodon furcidens TaxID=33524 RepID=A0ABV0THL2_9TELE